MADRYTVTAHGSVVAVGPGSRARGIAAGSTGADLDAARAQLARLEEGLASLPPSRDAARAAVRVADLREVADDDSPDPDELVRGWSRLRTALAALGITGMTAFGADLAQIAGTIVGQ